MKKENKSISLGKLGMNRDAHPSSLTETEYSYAKNAILEDTSGNGFPSLQNEPSNILCAKFGADWKVIGFLKDLNGDTTYFFMHNETTKESEIGKIDTINNIKDIEDVAIDCGCDIKKILSEPLENQDPQSTCTYETILNDNCNQCLNFDVNHPIRDAQLKDEKCGRRIYWTDGENPPRYLDLDNLQQYKEMGVKTCDTDVLPATCLDCEKLKMFPCFEIPCLTPEEVQHGGNLKKGTYEFLMAYCDIMGNEISNYYSIVNPISIFDENNVILTQPELDDRTGMGIRLNVSNLDTKMEYYKVAVIQRTDVNEATSYFIEGVHNITDNTILYTSELDKERTTLQHLATHKPHYTKSQHMVSSNGYLFQAGLESEKEYNLQPIANLLGSFTRWMTVEANENLYKDGINTSLYKSFLRNETYPLGIRFTGDCGYLTALYPLVSRVATDNDLELVYDGGGLTTDVLSTYDTTKACFQTDRVHRWQYEPTASVIGPCPAYGDSGTTITKETERFCEISEVDEISSGTYTIPNTSTVTDLVTFINNNKTDICDVSSPLYDATICAILGGTYPDTCTPDFSPLTCDNIVLDRDEILAESVDSIVATSVAADLATYTLTTEPPFCQIHAQPLANDHQFVGNVMNAGDIVYNRAIIPANMLSCSLAPLLPTVNGAGAAPNSIFLDYAGAAAVATLQDTRNSTVYGSEFTAKLHVGAVWHTMEFNSRTEMLLEITKQTSCTVQDDVVTGTEVRVSIYDDCVSTSTPIYTELVDLTTGTLINIPAASYSGNTVYIAVDAPIVQTKVPYYHTSPTCGCFGMLDREIEYDSTDIDYVDLKFLKREVYTADCDFYLPQTNGCAPAPFEYGKFGYMESLETYANNSELFDSRSLTISRSDLPADIQSEFEDAFVAAVGAGNDYILNDNADLRCKPIRHFKMPCGSIAPIMGTQPLQAFQEALIYPLGVMIDPEVVNSFLNVAVRSSLITQTQRDAITGYEIFRGDRTIHKSILAKGVMYDMYKYEEEGTDVLYSNYPYNDLGKDDLHYTDKNRTTLIDHPYGGTENHRWTFHSPDTHFEKPQLGSEMRLEGYMYGASRGHFLEVEEHPKWIVLTQAAENTAKALALVESLFEAAVAFGEAVSHHAISGTAGGVLLMIAHAAYGFTVGRWQKQYEWHKIFRDNGQMRNFGHYYTSEGYYNYMEPNTDVANNMLRGLTAARYIKDGRLRVTESDTGLGVKVNNLDRESSVYLSVDSEYPVQYKSSFTGFDNSRTTAGAEGDFTETKSKEIEKQIASAYVSIENYVPNQYGTLDGIKWLSTSKCNSLQALGKCSPIFGGDTFLSRFSLKRKVPMFHTTAMGLASLTPFNYHFYNNIGDSRYFVDYELNEAKGATLFPTINSDYNFDTERKKNFYFKEPSRFYLYYYGIPQFIVESDINTNYRYAKKEGHERFYPLVQDYIKWTQEVSVSIRHDNTFFYNRTYSKDVTPTGVRMLPSTYEKELYDCKYDEPNAVIYSIQDNSEQELTDPWLSYRPLDKYQFPASSGNLIDLRALESTQILGRFENEVMVFNSIDKLQERLSPTTTSLGTGGVFAQRPLSFSKTDLGYAGTQHKAMVSCEFGHYWVDAKRGQVFKINQAGKNLTEISSFSEGAKSVGMRNWFKEHLPFKILKGKVQGLTHDNVDNEYKGLGIAMGWDARFRRVFITKRDYRVQPNFEGMLEYVANEFRVKETNEVVELTDETYFEDCSFTVAYSPIVQKWISYYDFKPNYYINHNNYFQTGIVGSKDNSENGLWSHLLTNKSFQVFYGKKYPFTVEFPVKEQYTNKILNSVQYWTDSRRYHNEYDFAENRAVAFNRGWVYNNSQNSGEMNFVVQEKNNLRQSVIYPKVVNNTTEVLITESDKKWSLNSFFNRVKRGTNNVPLWNKDCNDIGMTINKDALDYRKGFQDRLRGDWFLIRLTNDDESRYKIIFKWLLTNETVYTS